MNKHALVQRDGFMVPLIGVPPAAVIESCDCCGDDIGLAKAVFNGSQVLCPKCAAPPATPRLTPEPGAAGVAK